MSEWISVGSKKPEHLTDVVCFVNDIVSSWQVILRYDEMNGFWCDYWGGEFECIVTHWKPLGENPRD